jgi:hypothetical protein
MVEKLLVASWENLFYSIQRSSLQSVGKTTQTITDVSASKLDQDSKRYTFTACHPEGHAQLGQIHGERA